MSGPLADSGGLTEELWVTLSDGLKVYTKTWQTTLPSGHPHALLFFLHGFSDHCNAYSVLFPTLASRGIQTTSFDQRGWGRTCASLPACHKGRSGPSAQLLKDIDEVLAPILTAAASSTPPIPVFVGGHSMGGGIALWYALHSSLAPQLAGVYVHSPLFAVHPSSTPNPLIVAGGKLGAKLLPNVQMVQKLDPALMSRDPAVCKAFEEDPLCHDTGTLIGLSDMLARGKELVEGKGKGWTKPVLVMHGTADKVTDPEASRKWTEELKGVDATFRPYEGWYHKMHAEPGDDKLRFANDVADWILQRAASGTTEQARL